MRRNSQALLRRRAPADLLAGIADHSPYLWRLAVADPVRLGRLVGAAPEASLERNLAALRADCDTADSDADLMHALRLAKQEVALLIALADIGGVWDVVSVTEALTRFADGVVGAALGFLLRRAAAEGKLDLADPAAGAGVVVLAFGKHGARELNYSSDIDLVVFFDPAAPVRQAGGEPIELFVRMTKALVRLLQERTRDGYVLRVDLRLRPDPGSTSVAISLPAAFSYYETVGQNWERAALIKARPVAGDIALGRRFLADLSAFIWRKYFDYAAIADIHAMKRQIHAVRGHAEIAVAGHDLKLGRGGIREIEFFVQTQQLIFGGRRRQLRGARTLDMLVELAEDGWITAEARDDLSAAYLYLRHIEHRLQMVADEQTQRLPADPEQLAGFARFCGYTQTADFAAELTGHLERVEKHYARLFEHAPGLDAAGGSLVFTGATDDPETIETLAELGFHDPVESCGDRPRLAFRASRRHPERACQGSPDRTRSGSLAGFRRERRCRCGARRLRQGARAHVGRGRIAFHPEVQSAGARIVRRYSRRRAASRRYHRAASACARRGDRSGTAERVGRRSLL